MIVNHVEHRATTETVNRRLREGRRRCLLGAGTDARDAVRTEP